MQRVTPRPGWGHGKILRVGWRTCSRRSARGFGGRGITFRPPKRSTGSTVHPLVCPSDFAPQIARHYKAWCCCYCCCCCCSGCRRARSPSRTTREHRRSTRASECARLHCLFLRHRLSRLSCLSALVPPGTTARVSHRSGRPRSREPGTRRPPNPGRHPRQQPVPYAAPAQRCDQHAGRHDRQPGVGVRLGLVRGNYCRLSRLSVSLRRPRPSDGYAQRAGAVDRRGGSDAVCVWVPQGQNVVRERDGRCARVAALRPRPCCRFPQRSRHLVITQMRACGGAVCAQCTSRRQSWRAKQCHGS